MLSAGAVMPASRRSVPEMARRLAEVAAGKLPGLHGPLEAAYGRHFNRVAGHARLFRGIYPDFAAAMRDIPAERSIGYDNEPSAHGLADDRSRIFPFDYPVMFWLEKLLPECKLLFDWGGNVGISYFAYRKYLRYPEGFTWLVNDVPAVVALGERIAAEGSSPGLRLTTTLDEIERADLLLAAGSLHFIQDPFAPLRSAKALPRHVLLNKVPAYSRASAVTLENMGTAFSPYHLFNRDRFVRNFEDLGYRLIDEWRCPELSCWIPFFREHAIPAYSGFYFTRPA